MNNRSINIFIAVVLGIIIIGFSFALYQAKTPGSAIAPGGSSVSTVDGTQIIDITAKGGYSPRQITAQAGIPTMIRMRTNGTYDCSSSLVIPKLKYRKALSPTGVEEIQISADQAQGTMQGLCGMGMYQFKVVFQ